ncbi:MAG: cyclic nucleotide-binding domain-containing protein [Anaerolineae bacterium]
MSVVQLLKKVDTFNGLSEEQLKKVATLFQKHIFNAGDIILKENTRSDDMYVIEEGLVEIIVDVGEGESASPGNGRSIVNLGRGRVFGEMALVDQGLRSATVRCAADNSKLYSIRREDFLKLCEEDTRIGYIVMHNIAADLSFKLRVRNLAWR